MNKRIIVGLGIGLLVAVPALALAKSALAAPLAARKEAVQVQTPLDSHGVGFQETNLGDLIADAVRQAGKAEISLVAAGEIHEMTIPAGAVPPGKIVDALRYASDPNDTIVVLNLTGAQIAQAMERSVSRAPQPFDGFFQVSGLKVQYNPAHASEQRISLLTVGGAAIDTHRTYRVATTRSVAEGGMGYFRVWNHEAIVDSAGVTVAAGLTTYLSAHMTVNSVTDNRITTR